MLTMTLPTHPIFLTCINHIFQVQAAANNPIALKLTSVSELRESPASSPTHPIAHFSLIFESDQQEALPQQIYRFDNPTTGLFDMFIVPIGPDPVSRQMRYQAIFN
ncbi:DUF6916 family protein [Undibacterium fentianense]|uniref:DUF6916 family protein n=1 Tax=Undibacterium fentianense TaxID=2828728 RepID=UPI001BAF7C31|nr:hypothetical protein [Undibacterium fentianense]